jgi:hypothetical protein
MMKRFICKRCKREYGYPEPGSPPIKCECGWWYENVRGKIREAFWERIDPYRDPPPTLFSKG